MSRMHIHAVTGAFGYSGTYIARRLLDGGYAVRTLTNSVHRKNPFDGKIDAYPFNFDKPELLVESLSGVSVLYNTYWIRFNLDSVTHDGAVKNSLALLKAAKSAGVERVVHVSITNPSEDSPLPYFHGKAVVEKALRESGLSYAIMRPAVLFGREDILVNNIAWTLRRFPVFGIFGDGNYRLRPIFVDDLAKLAVEQGENRENRVIDAVGPETFTYRDLVIAIGGAIGKKRLIMPVPPVVAYFAGRMMGMVMRDILLTRDEIKGLMADLLYVDSEPAGETRLTVWMSDNAESLGKRYANELVRRRDRLSEY